MKKFKKLDEQIKRLVNHKKIVVDNHRRAKSDLYDGNYYNVISCSKIKFAQTIANNDHQYSDSEFKEWMTYFRMDCRVSEYLMKNMLNFERIINSRVAYQISKLIEHENLTDHERNEIFQLINGSTVWKQKREYDGREAWIYITKMTFGEMKQLLFWLLENRITVYAKVVFDFPYLQLSKNNKVPVIHGKINELNNLRNCLFHFTPLTIYVTYGKSKSGKLKNGYRKRTINWIFTLNMDLMIAEKLQEIFNHSDRFIKIKNSQHMTD